MPGRFFSFIFSVVFLLTLSLQGGEFRTILGGKDKRTEEGYTFYNRYCQIAFLNPSAHSSRITTGDFAIMQRSDVQGRHTLDERIAKLRIFFKPDLTVRTDSRRPVTIHGDEAWSMQQLTDGMKYTRIFQKDDYAVQAEVTVSLPPERACIEFEYAVKNTGKQSCTIDVIGQFNFLRNGVEPLQLILEREMIRYQDGKKETFLSNVITELNSKVQSYWWRRVVRDQKIFGNNFNREHIPFNQPRLVAPGMFGFAKLAGDGVLIWDLADDSKLDELDVSWDSEHGEVEPCWKLKLAAGDSRVIKFRVLTVKGLPRFNSVGEDWVFGFIANGNHLQVTAVPLESQDRLSMNFSISDARGQVLISQRNELPTTMPFTPAKVDLRATAAFQINVGYAFKLSISTLTDNSHLLDVSGNMIP